ncbi:hypothetical protein NRIC_07740 [Enterococcus florum]|uniref:Uncharacterized protein n=1 Tax=Enterococcus florum TaxID=2480627 RepID=A0A4P5PHJ2_9ENTE|nr:hypothetical protein [Enterococcus florum]GCF92883.1 hypothetical protein NRIC_07740 [Enterococcus florum]
MRGTVSENQRHYFYESPFLMQGENQLSLSELRTIFIRTLANNPHANYVSGDYFLEKKQRRVTIWRKDGKSLSREELFAIDEVLPKIFETY